MTAIPRDEPAIVNPLDLEAAAAALCCRFGEASAEAYRRSTLHDLLGTSRTLARTLEEFTAVASAHYRGVHCTADMRGDAQRLAHALAAWSDSVFAAGTGYREWTADGAITGLSIGRASDSDLAPSFASYMHDDVAPPARSA
jgi:hypothetical protein